ncbi:MAG: hypothetical protein AAFV88_24010 [Planctomycetota bacterium]
MNRKLALALAFLLPLALFAAGCSSIPTGVAAPVPLQGYGDGSSQVEKGRATYVSFLKCAMCHRPKPVYDYDVETWRDDILPRMSKKARLNPEQYNAVLAYVTSDIAQTPPVED